PKHPPPRPPPRSGSYQSALSCSLPAGCSGARPVALPRRRPRPPPEAGRPSITPTPAVQSPPLLSHHRVARTPPPLPPPLTSHASSPRADRRNGERVEPAPPDLRAGPGLLRLRRRRPRRLHQPGVHAHGLLLLLHHLLAAAGHALRRHLLPRHPAGPVVAAALAAPHLVALPARAPDALLRRTHRVVPRRPPPPPQGHLLPPLLHLHIHPHPPARSLLGPNRRQVQSGLVPVPGASLRVLRRRRRQRRGGAGRGRPGGGVHQGEVRGPDPLGAVHPPRVPHRPGRGGGAAAGRGGSHGAGPVRRGRAGARGGRGLLPRRRRQARGGGALGQRGRQARRARAAPALELPGQPDGVRGRGARRRPVGPPRLVVPGPARLRRRDAPRQERAREPALAGGGGQGARVRAPRAGLEDAALILVVL
ncbi:hypothetical protein ZEAMMB73_Zm00001d004918, partial [Zea mays]